MNVQVTPYARRFEVKCESGPRPFDVCATVAEADAAPGPDRNEVFSRSSHNGEAVRANLGQDGDHAEHDRHRDRQ